jgi:plastocyanin
VTTIQVPDHTNDPVRFHDVASKHQGRRGHARTDEAARLASAAGLARGGALGLGVLVALLVSVLPPKPVAAQVGAYDQTGRIDGTLSLGESVAGRKVRFRPYATPGAVPVQADEPVNELLNVLVYVDSGPALQPAPRLRPARGVIRQADERFVPHVLPVVRGSTVAFPNDDRFFHNVFSLSSAASFDLGRYPEGDSKSVEFSEPGVVQVFCHIHSDMSAIVRVFDHPFFASPDRDGRFAIDGLAPGRYRVVVWHERLEPTVRRIRVAPGQPTTVQWMIPRPPPEEPR